MEVTGATRRARGNSFCPPRTSRYAARALSRVFTSYRREDDAHCARVRDLATRLEQTGVTVVLDEFAQSREFHDGGPNEGWPRWSKQQASDSAHKILIIASASWLRCYEGKELPGTGLGAAAESGVIEQRRYNATGVSADIRIVTLVALDPSAVPLDLQRYQRFADPEKFSDLVHWLTGTAPAVVSAWPDTPLPLHWPVADHAPVRAAFACLLTRPTDRRFLLLRGPSEAGKSHLTRQMLGNALRLPGLACGRYDFKGTTAGERELSSFVQNLEVPLPAGGHALADRFSHLLAALKQRAHPALLIFDTYELAGGEARDWVEKQLLPALLRAPWLRVVIAGQQVPEFAGAAWALPGPRPVATDRAAAGGLDRLWKGTQDQSDPRVRPAGAHLLRRQGQPAGATPRPRHVTWISPPNSGCCRPRTATRRSWRWPPWTSPIRRCRTRSGRA